MHLPRGHELLELCWRVDADCAHVVDQIHLHDIDCLDQSILLVGEQQRVVAHFANGVDDGHLPRHMAIPGAGQRQCETDAEAAGDQH